MRSGHRAHHSRQLRRQSKHAPHAPRPTLGLRKLQPVTSLRMHGLHRWHLTNSMNLPYQPNPRRRPTLITCGCGLVPGLVTGLNLTFNNLSGSFPDSLNALFPTRGTLQSLMLSRNRLTSECAPLELALGCSSSVELGYAGTNMGCSTAITT